MATALSHAPITMPDAVRRGAVLGDYDSACRDFSWSAARAELSGLPGGTGLNIAFEAVDRHANGARDPHDDLRDVLGLDSLDFLAVVTRVSERTGRRIEEDDDDRLTDLDGWVRC